MTEQEYEQIRRMISNGISLRQAAGNPSRMAQFLRLRKKKGDIRPNSKPIINFPPLHDDSQVPNIKTLVDMAKRSLLRRLREVPYDASCIKQIILLGEKELPEWQESKNKAVKDEYQAILESVVKKSKGFTILERTDSNDNDNAGNENKASAG